MNPNIFIKHFKYLPFADSLYSAMERERDPLLLENRISPPFAWQIFGADSINPDKVILLDFAKTYQSAKEFAQEVYFNPNSASYTWDALSYNVYSLNELQRLNQSYVDPGN